MSDTFHGVIVDLGVSEGNDSAYYLAKGFRVVGVEADPRMVLHLRERFSNEIASGAYEILPFAASDRIGDTIEFHAHMTSQGLSSDRRRSEVNQSEYTTHKITTIDWKGVKARQGTPRYLKMDIELAEEKFLSGMVGELDLPEFISLEFYNIEPALQLRDMGYSRFRFIDQQPEGGFRLPQCQWEGNTLSHWQFNHATGPFGLDVFGNGPWLTFEELRSTWENSRPLMAKTWFDCHAWKPR